MHRGLPTCGVPPSPALLTHGASTWHACCRRSAGGGRQQRGCRRRSTLRPSRNTFCCHATSASGGPAHGLGPRLRPATDAHCEHDARRDTDLPEREQLYRGVDPASFEDNLDACAQVRPGACCSSAGGAVHTDSQAPACRSGFGTISWAMRARLARCWTCWRTACARCRCDCVFPGVAIAVLHRWDAQTSERACNECGCCALPPRLQGPPPAWYGRSTWDARDIKGIDGNSVDLSSHRALLRNRTSEQRREWRHNEAAQAALRESIKAVLVQVYVEHEEVRRGLRWCGTACGRPPPPHPVLLVAGFGQSAHEPLPPPCS